MDQGGESTVVVPVQIRFADLDMAKHVHNAVYLQWFELARMALLERVVPKEHDWEQHGLILARNEVDHRAPVRLHDRVEALAWCSAIGTKSFDLSYRIVRMQDEQRVICAEGRSVLVCYDYRAQCSIALPAPWRSALTGLLR